MSTHSWRRSSALLEPLTAAVEPPVPLPSSLDVGQQLQTKASIGFSDLSDLSVLLDTARIMNFSGSSGESSRLSLFTYNVNSVAGYSAIFDWEFISTRY